MDLRRARCGAAVLLLAYATVAGCSPRPERVVADVNPAALAQLPGPVADAFRRLDREIAAEDRDTLRATAPGEMVRYHMGLGMYVRNQYGLWQGGPLQDYFRGRGVRHPDDMSDALLEAYGMYLRGAPVNLDSILAAVRPPPLLEPPPPSDSAPA